VRKFARIPGVLIEAIGESWVAYSPASGASHLLNDSSVFILDAVESSGVASSVDLVSTIALEVDRPRTEIETMLQDHWDELIHAGLIRERLSTE
jgi:hypothetical protein